MAGGILAAVTLAAWQAAIAASSHFPIWPAYVCGGLAAAVLYMCFATVWRWWPSRPATNGAPPSDSAKPVPPGKTEATASSEDTDVTDALVNAAVIDEGLDEDVSGEELAPSSADLLAQRFGAEWQKDIDLFAKLKQHPSFEDVSAALYRGAELNLISKHGIRAPLEHTSTYIRIPHPDDWLGNKVPLHVEARWLEEILVYEWPSGQPFVEMLFSLAMRMRPTVYWEGEQSYAPEATFEHFSELLLYGIETIRKGHASVINRIFQIFDDDWVITEWELIDKVNHYQVLFSRLDESDWLSHVTEKTWVNRSTFELAFGTSQMLIYDRIFEGDLPSGWKPPKMWPFKIVLPDGTVML